jgi:threonine dehydrogenase-like Zn-dependent dehydrogenase
MGQYTLVPEQVVFPLPANVSLEAAALAEPLSCCLHAINLANIRPGDRGAILGAGAMGLMLLQLARRAGASRVLVTDLAPHRREMALRFGADVVIDPTTDNVATAALEMSGGIGVDVALEAVGARQTVLDCIALPRRAGTAVLVGVASPSLEIPVRPYDIYERELTIKGSFIRAYEFQRTIELLPVLDLEPLITDEFPLSQAPQALENVRRRNGIKTVIRP